MNINLIFKIVLLEGNPGNEGFYADFGERLLKSLMSRDERAGGECGVGGKATITTCVVPVEI